MLRLTAIAVLAAAIGTAAPAMAITGWDAKATASERAASAAVGGFDATQRVLYHQGLEHLYHTHQRIGSFTIRQVVNQERAREAARRGAFPTAEPGKAAAGRERESPSRLYS